MTKPPTVTASGITPHLGRTKLGIYCSPEDSGLHEPGKSRLLPESASSQERSHFCHSGHFCKSAEHRDYLLIQKNSIDYSSVIDNPDKFMEGTVSLLYSHSEIFFLQCPGSVATPTIGSVKMDVRQELTDCILDADREGAMNLIQSWSIESPIEGVVEDVLVPVLAKLSTLWAKLTEPPLAPAYVTSRVIKDIMQLVKDSGGGKKVQEKLGPVILCNIEDDFHSLGREVVVSFLEANGWKVHDLGNDVIAADLVDRAVEIGAKVVGVSAMMLTTAFNIRSVREEIDKRRLNIKLAVGGAIFTLRDTLLDQVGGDGTCKTATGAHNLFKSLWAEAEKAEGVCHE